jgi:hypothetical protein
MLTNLYEPLPPPNTAGRSGRCLRTFLTGYLPIETRQIKHLLKLGRKMKIIEPDISCNL